MNSSRRRWLGISIAALLLAGPLTDDALARRTPVARRARVETIKKKASRLLAGIVALSLVAPAVPALGAPPQLAAEPQTSSLSTPPTQPFGRFYVPSAKDGTLLHTKDDINGQTPWTYPVLTQLYAKNPVGKHLLDAAYYGLHFEISSANAKAGRFVLEARDNKTGDFVGIVKLKHDGAGVSVQIDKAVGKASAGLWVLQSALAGYGTKL